MAGGVKGGKAHERSVFDRIAEYADKAGINLQRVGVDKSHAADATGYLLHPHQQAVVEDAAFKGRGLSYTYFDELPHTSKEDWERMRASINPKVLREKTLADFNDAELVMEMIRRGYAAMKLPEQGDASGVIKP